MLHADAGEDAPAGPAKTPAEPGAGMQLVRAPRHATTPMAASWARSELEGSASRTSMRCGSSVATNEPDAVGAAEVGICTPHVEKNLETARYKSPPRTRSRRHRLYPKHTPLPLPTHSPPPIGHWPFFLGVGGSAHVQCFGPGIRGGPG